VPWESVVLLCRRSWFTRIWVVQEFVVSKKLEYLCGNHSFPAEKLWMATQHLVKEGYIGFMSEGNFGIEETKRVSKMFDIREQRMNSASSPDASLSISQLLADFRNREATVPHDMIYGLLGLFKIPSPDNHLPSPDYDKSFRDVCVEWAAHSLLNENNLDILYSCEGWRSAPEWPSWVPDWSIITQPVISLREVYPGWSATRGTQANVKISIAERSLKVSGLHIGVIKQHDLRSDVIISSRGIEAFPDLLKKETQHLHPCKYSRIPILAQY
jgi:hypothetical protein